MKKKKPIAKPARRKRKPGSLVIRTLREQVRFLSREYQFLKGKCERLELAVLESRPGAPAAYVARTDEAARPPINEVPIPKARTHRELSALWDSLSMEEQEKHIANGDWDAFATKGAN